MKTKTAVILQLFLIVVAVAYSCYVNTKLPEIVPTHWNWKGEPDKFSSKNLTLWMMPITMSIIMALMLGLPKMSPKEFSIKPFLPTFNAIMAIVNFMMGYLHFVIIQATLHRDFDILKWMCVGMFLCFAMLGNLLGKVRRNYWMGIRTPWTLSSNANWIATHRFAAWSITGTGIGATLAILWGLNWLVCMSFVVLSFMAPIVYSFYLFTRKV